MIDEKLYNLIKSSRRIVALTGAGVSTLSGIPDFRSAGGVYSKKFGTLSVEKILDIDFFNNHPDIFYAWAKDGWYKMHDYQPSIIHNALKKMEDIGKLSDGIFTQNIDGLHTRAGSKRVYELHGSIENATCKRCGESLSFDSMAEIVKSNAIPVCPKCGTLLKPDIVFYGEGLDSSMLYKAEDSFSFSDLVLVLGSSLVVNPAASLPYYSARNRRKIVLVNRDSTYLDQYATLCYDDLESFGAMLMEICERIARDNSL